MIGRKVEVKRIKSILKSKKSEFIAITGRRRVGKTYLIDSMFKEYYCFNMTGIQNGNTTTQLVNFGIKLSEYNQSNNTTPDNWQIAFSQLKNYLKTLDSKQKQVIFIDELPWVYTPRSGFIQLLAHLWNDYLSKQNHFILVICGSATSWITKKIINDKGGLHNRVTESIHLQPFDLIEARAFLQFHNIYLTVQEVAKIYMVLGGIPFYLEKIKKGESFASAIERICFSSSGPLKNEYSNLYAALFKNSNLHQSIVRALATTQQGLTNKELLGKLNMKDNGSYQRAIEELTLSNFIEEYIPYNKTKRNKQFRLIDEYTLFYHKFIEKNQKYVQGMWQQITQGQSYKIWSGYSFETLCQKHISLIKNVLGISGVYTETSSLRVQGNQNQNGFQIDLIIDRRDNTINLCEMKFYSGPFTIDKAYYKQLIQKKQRFIDHTKTRKQIFITLITNHGLTENPYALEIADVSITLDDLFNAMGQV